MSSKRLVKLIKLTLIVCTTSMMVSIWVLGQSDNASTNQSTIPRDPGIRGGPPGAGGPLPGLQVNEDKLHREGLARSNELEATCNGCSDIVEGGDS
ncbi:MAG: hypothetical protein ACRD4L_05955, partial [Pyrinomonadaceae bacterium]